VAAANYAAIGDVNVTNYDDYAWADPAALKAFKRHDDTDPVGSLETTHGLIRLQSEAPFLFISGITNRVGYFNMEVAPRAYAQNFVCAHNAGVVATWLLPRLATYV
jgi:hypothetical protein